jgi:hypothetical protein
MAASSRALLVDTKNKRSGTLPKVRHFFAALLITFASISIALFVIIGWAHSQLLDTDNWVEFVTPLPKDPAVAYALSDFVTSNVLETDRVEPRIKEVLPERAGFLAPVLTERLQARAQQTTENIISSDAFEAVWISANQTAHQRLVDQARGEASEPNQRNQHFSVNLQSVRAMAAERLGESAQALGATGDAAKRPLRIEADLRTRPRRFAQFVKSIDFLNKVLPMLILAVGVWGIVLTRNRRRAILAIGALTSVALLVVLIAIKATKSTLLAQVNNEAYKPAVGTIYDSLLASLSGSVGVWLILAILVWLAALLFGSNRYAARLQQLVNTEKLFETKIYTQWRIVRLWLADQKYYFWTIIIMIALFYLAFVVSIDKEVATNTLFAIIAAIGLVHLLATPPYLINGHHRSTARTARNNSR